MSRQNNKEIKVMLLLLLSYVFLSFFFSLRFFLECIFIVVNAASIYYKWILFFFYYYIFSFVSSVIFCPLCIVQAHTLIHSAKSKPHVVPNTKKSSICCPHNLLFYGIGIDNTKSHTQNFHTNYTTGHSKTTELIIKKIALRETHL